MPMIQWKERRPIGLRLEASSETQTVFNATPYHHRFSTFRRQALRSRVTVPTRSTQCHVFSLYPLDEHDFARMTNPPTRSQERLLKWDDLLPWQKDNEYILTGYRQASFSVTKSTMSVISTHNETVNIRSHLTGALLFSIVPLYAVCRLGLYQTNANIIDDLPVAIYLAGVTTCFLLSSFYHTFLNHSKEVWKLGNELDHLGIVFVIWGSMVPSDYFGFYCNPELQYCYITIVWLFSRVFPKYLLKCFFVCTGFSISHRLWHLHIATKLQVPVLKILASDDAWPPWSTRLCSGFARHCP